MKLKKIIAAFIVGSLLTAGLAFAAEKKKDAAPAAAKIAGCCAKAAKDGKACGHECCVTAAKEGKNCEKCGGSGKAEVKKPAPAPKS